MTEYEAFEQYLDAPCDWDMLGKPISRRGQMDTTAQTFAFVGFQAAWRQQQAEIDRLMLEFCPDEMTESQKAEWARNQKPVPEQEQKALDAALATLTHNAGGNATPLGGRVD